ncbi:hypothetical protein INR49_031859 [Caranx melampygus]|nr:hypothetical protein INR49_031859 [Caranx melampygus]
MRTESRKIVVLVTDGKSMDDVTSPARNLKDNGIEIYTVGVGDANIAELWSTASEPKDFHLYYAMDSSSFSDIIDNLTMDLCTSSKNTESVRLMNGTSLCSGRLEVKLNQSNQWWSSVCEADFDQQDAEVVCRELGCLAPSVLQGGLYGEAQAPMWTKEFQCEGRESALLDCRSSDSTRSTCSPGQAAGLTCSEPVKLVGGASRCEGTLRVKWRVWRPVMRNDWTLKEAAIACRELDCGSALLIGERRFSKRSVWRIRSDCVQSGSTLRECSSSNSSSLALKITCSGKPKHQWHHV